MISRSEPRGVSLSVEVIHVNGNLYRCLSVESHCCKEPLLIELKAAGPAGEGRYHVERAYCGTCEKIFWRAAAVNDPGGFSDDLPL